MSIVEVCVLIPLIIIAAIVWYYYQYYNLMKTLKNIKGPMPIPLLGNALEFKTRNAILATYSKLFRQHGKLVKLIFGLKPIVLVGDYKTMEAVLGSNKILEKTIFYKFLQNWVGLGLLTSSGAKWKQRRRILTPAYHFEILEQFVPIFSKVSDTLVDEFRNEKNKDSVDVYPYITLSTLDVICETAMGVSIDAQKNKTSAYVQSVKEMGRIVIDRIFQPLQQIDFLYRFTENYRIEQKCLRILHGHTNSVISNRRAEIARKEQKEQKQQEKSENADDFGKKKRIAFLDLLLSSTDEYGQPLSDADIREEVDTFMFEGNDTTSSGISFALFEIANNPDVQQKILDEQDEIFHGENRPITYNDLNQMKYLEMVIKETLRLYPSVPFIGRQITSDFKINDDVTIPAGFTVTIVPYEIQRDPKYFPEPNKFNPDRFRAENNIGKFPYCFIPFSAGPRNCIGQKFAILEMKMTLSKIVRNFELMPTVPGHTLDLTSEIILKSDNGILVKIKERNLNE